MAKTWHFEGGSPDLRTWPFVRDEGGSSVCKVMLYGKMREEARANGMLIASAPELNRKLKRLAEIWRKTTVPAADAMHREGMAALSMAEVQEITEILLT